MALANGIESSEEILNAQTLIWNQSLSFVKSVVLKCAVKLKIPDIIHNHNQPIRLADLANALSINPAKTPCLARLMRVLVHSNLFSVNETGFGLTPASRLLLTDEPWSLAAFVLGPMVPGFTDLAHSMCEWFRDSNATPFVTSHGTNLWEMPEENAWQNEAFNKIMSADTEMLMSVILKDAAHVFQGLESIVDVGGGRGTLAKLVARAFPLMHCTVLDLPHVVRGLEGTLNLEYMAGDMFVAIPDSSCSSCFTKDCIKILKKCKEAIGSKENGGKVIIIDIVVGNDNKNLETQLLFDILMMILSTGRERTAEDWANIFHHSGFTTYRFTHLGLRSLIEVFP